MNQTILNYPGFQALPKGAKQMLLVSESYFFEEGPPPGQLYRYALAPILKTNQGLKTLLQTVSEWGPVQLYPSANAQAIA
ncbi:MAG: hypothetical protein ACLQVY_20260 [Limisphaerales bacterium]